MSDDHELHTLRRFYSLGDNDEESVKEPVAPDYARGGVLLESSDENEDETDSEPEPAASGYNVDRTVDQSEIDLDEDAFAALDAQAAINAEGLTVQNDQPEATRTRRLAVVNLDWDHVKAIHLFKIFSSLVSPAAPHPELRLPTKDGARNTIRGKVLSVRVYPSEFGKEQLSREEKEGPPVELFKKKNRNEEEEINEQNVYEVGNDDGYDDDVLRSYQLMRLR